MYKSTDRFVCYAEFSFHNCGTRTPSNNVEPDLVRKQCIPHLMLNMEMQRQLRDFCNPFAFIALKMRSEPNVAFCLLWLD